MSRLEQFSHLRHGTPNTGPSCQTCFNPANIPISNQFVCTGQPKTDAAIYQRGGNQQGGNLVQDVFNGVQGAVEKIVGQVIPGREPVASSPESAGPGQGMFTGYLGSEVLPGSPLPLDSQIGCLNCKEPAMETDTNPCLIKSRHYVQPWTDRPSYYLDLTSECIGGRPVRRAHNVNAIPRTMRFDTTNMACNDFYCQQPYWKGNCV